MNYVGRGVGRGIEVDFGEPLPTQLRTPLGAFRQQHHIGHLCAVFSLLR